MLNKHEKEKLKQRIEDEVFRQACRTVYSGVSIETILSELLKEFPFMYPNVLLMGIKKKWIEIVRSNLQLS